LTVVIEGLPAGLPVTAAAIDADLARRQQGYGRGGRMKIETDRVAVRSGIRHGRTTGTPVALTIDNRDYQNWVSSMGPDPLPEGVEPEDVALTRPRPGHTDLAGAMKLMTHDVRNILERASARHTAARVAAGAVAKALLASQGVSLVGHVLAIGGVAASPDTNDLERLREVTNASPVRCADPAAEKAMIELIDATRKKGDSLGGRVEVIVDGVPPGLGHFAEWDRRLDGRLARAVMSIPAIKAFEIGDGFAAGSSPGSAVHDEIVYDAATRRYGRPTNRAGGIEGGLTNGERVVVRAVMKPIPTLARPLRSVDLVDHSEADAGKERTDSVAVPACAVVCEAAVAWEMAVALLERFGGDTLDELTASYGRFKTALDGF
jgi:chorismate synthase